MAVLIEAYSVIVRVQAIRDKYFGGVKAFMDDIPNSTFCTDGAVGRVGFMSLDDAFFYSAELMKKGLHSEMVDENTDIAYAMQDVGVMEKCSWLIAEKLIIDKNGNEVTACSLIGSAQQGLSVPENWRYENYASLRKANEEDFEAVEQVQDSSVLKVVLKDEIEQMYIGVTSLKIDNDEPLH